MKKRISYGRQSISARDIAAVSKALRSDALTQGPEVPKFEIELSKVVGAAHSVAFNSATSALHGACHALGVGPGDIVWTSAISFVASANCAVYCGAEVDFVDVDPGTGNISISALSTKLKEAKLNSTLPKVLIPVHFAGQPCDMREISLLAKSYGFKVIEDASHALGATYLGEPVGNCRFSEITVFSFHPVKMITTGEGGSCSTNSPELSRRLVRFRSHGITREPQESIASIDGPWSYDQIDLGYNYRMTDFQASLGTSQLRRLRSFVHKRNAIARSYDAILKDSPWRPLGINPDRTNSYHLYVVQNNGGPEARSAIYKKMNQAGITLNVHYRPIYRNTFYAKMEKFDPLDYPGAESYYSSAVSLPIYPGLGKSNTKKIAKSLGD